MIPSCKSSVDQQPAQTLKKQDKEELIRVNKDIMRSESADIDSYIRRKNYHMNLTPTGLRYLIYSKSNSGLKVRTDDQVKLKYSLSLLDGSQVYNSDTTGLLEFIVDKSEIVTGLQEGVKYLEKGDKAIFIIPAHLAYGLTGDGEKIKYYEALVIDTEVLEITNAHRN